MNEQMDRDLRAIEDLAKGRIALDYRCWRLHQFYTKRDEGWIFALYPSSKDVPTDSFAVFYSTPPSSKYFLDLAKSELDDAVWESQREWIESWQAFGEEGAEAIVKVHEENSIAAGVPISFISFGMDFGHGSGTHLYHPRDLPITLCFDWLRTAASRYISSRN